MSAPHELASPPSDAISSVKYSLSGAKLAVGSWDNSIHIYSRSDVEAIPYTFAQKITSPSPILDIAWGGDENTLFYVGLNHEVRRVKLDSEEHDVLSSHEKATNKVAYSQSLGLVFSTSWDGTLHVHDAETKNFIRVRLAAKPFALSITAEKAVVAMAERKVSVYDLHAFQQLVHASGGTADMQDILEIQPWQQRESILKFMTRDISCMPDGTGFATSSIEGRVGVEWFDPDRQKDMYAFKCHRQTQTATDDDGEDTEVDIVYPVNALAWHPVHLTFATGGGDGAVAIWDSQSKRRVKQFKELGASVAAMDFSPDGRFLAVGICPGFEDGKVEEETDAASVKVIIRELGENEAKPRPNKTEK